MLDIFTCVTLVGPLRLSFHLSVLTNGPLLGTLNLNKYFLKF